MSVALNLRFVSSPHEELELNEYYFQLLEQATFFAVNIARNVYFRSGADIGDFLPKTLVVEISNYIASWDFDTDTIKISIYDAYTRCQNNQLVQGNLHNMDSQDVENSSTFENNRSYVVKKLFKAILCTALDIEADDKIHLDIQKYIFELENIYQIWHEMYHRSTSQRSEGSFEIIQKRLTSDFIRYKLNQFIRTSEVDYYSSKIISGQLIEHVEESIIDLLALELAGHKIMQDLENSNHFLHYQINQSGIDKSYIQRLLVTFLVHGSLKDSHYPKIFDIINEIITEVIQKSKESSQFSQTDIDRQFILCLLEDRNKLGTFTFLVQEFYGCHFLEVFARKCQEKYPELLEPVANDTVEKK